METTWRIVARRGLDGTTLRQIAEEAGYANGAIKPYFHTKAALIEATYAHVAERTLSRIDAAAAGLRGQEALRALCLEVLPLDSDLLEEARLVLSFWGQAARHDAEAGAMDATFAHWRDRLVRALTEAVEDHTLAPSAEPSVWADMIATWLAGAQVRGVVGEGGSTVQALRSQLEALLRQLARP